MIGWGGAGTGTPTSCRSCPGRRLRRRLGRRIDVVVFHLVGAAHVGGRLDDLRVVATERACLEEPPLSGAAGVRPTGLLG